MRARMRMHTRVHSLRGLALQGCLSECTGTASMHVDAFMHHLHPIQVANSQETGRGRAQAEEAHPRLAVCRLVSVVSERARARVHDCLYDCCM